MKGEKTDKCLHALTCTHTHEGIENRQVPANMHVHTHRGRDRKQTSAYKHTLLLIPPSNIYSAKN